MSGLEFPAEGRARSVCPSVKSDSATLRAPRRTTAINAALHSPEAIKEIPSVIVYGQSLLPEPERNPSGPAYPCPGRQTQIRLRSHLCGPRDPVNLNQAAESWLAASSRAGLRLDVVPVTHGSALPSLCSRRATAERAQEDCGKRAEVSEWLQLAQACDCVQLLQSVCGQAAR
ncbi:hypothetical protein COCON_G00111400 [Conger conger]|uniref:Uncharacterized protein n=1 Tax=Conger conger TaxID=82655 RepID=A0A9Q1DJP2_CONCO|nr:hypothetical protein COCON_G00111400 [Conger conger]